MEENYSAEQVIEALASVGVPQQVIELVVPIAAYESRVDGVPFVHEAADKLSPSYGVFQINVDSEPAFYYQVMKNAGFNIEGLFTEEQIKQLESNIVGEDDTDVRDFSDDAQAKAKTFIAKSDLKTQAQLFKLVYDNKAKELETDEPMKILSNMYVMTVDKFNDKENEDAQKLKGKIEGDVSEYFSSKQKIKDDTSLFKQAEQDSMKVEDNEEQVEDAPNSFFPQRPTPAKNYYQLLKQISKVENVN